jgi:hypothetical protein
MALLPAVLEVLGIEPHRGRRMLTATPSSWSPGPLEV